MPARKDAAEATEVVKVRLSKALGERCQAARARGAHSSDAESTFLGYLIAVGLAKYEKAILPHEIGEDEGASLESRHTAVGE